MPSLDRSALIRVATACAGAFFLSGCATRFDAQGNSIYVWQFGQDTSTAVDYSNPRLPILPRGKTVDPLWTPPPASEPRDMSEWAQLTPLSPTATGAVGDNGLCAIACDPAASGAVVVARADVRSSIHVSAAR